MSFFEKLEKLVESKGTNFTELERNIGLGRGTIAGWKTRNPTYDKLVKVVNYLNADILWLMSEDLKNEPYSEKPSSSVLVKEDNALYEVNRNSYDVLDIDTQKAFNFLFDKIANKNTPEENRILSLYNLLGENEKNQILGMLELKVKECSDRKLKNSIY